MLSCISRDRVTGIVSSVGRFHVYPVTPNNIYWKYENTRHRPNFFVLFELAVRIETIEFVLIQSQHRSSRPSIWDGRTDGRNIISSVNSYDETRRHRKISAVCSADVELRTDECQPWMNPDGITFDFLKASSSNLENDLKRMIDNTASFFVACKELQRLSFVKATDLGSKFSMHRLVQTVIRGRMTLEQRLKIEKDVLGLNKAVFSGYSLESLNSEVRAKYRMFLPQVNSCLSHFDQDTYELFAISSLSDSIAGFLFEENQRLACVRLNVKILEIRTRMLGLEHPSTLRISVDWQLLMSITV